MTAGDRQPNDHPRLLLLRHGQIKANRQGRWHGSTDSALTWRGRRQAARTARHLARQQTPVRAIYSSPLNRCRTTAEAVGQRLGLPVHIHNDLREYAIGEWENLRFEELVRRHRFVARATEDHEFAPPGGGETLRQVAERMTGALDHIRRLPEADAGGPVLIVSHGAAMAVALGALLDDDPARWTDYHFANCSLTELVLSPVPYVNFFNLTHHL